MSLLLATLDRHARQRGDRPALTDGRRAITWRTLPGRIQDRAHVLQAHGVRVAGLELDNGIDWVLWDLAAIAAGCVCVPLPPFFHPAQRQHAIASAGIDHVITADGIVPTGIRAVDRPDGGMALPWLPPGTAKISFTSGSTAAPKGVCLPQAGLETVAQSVVDAVGPGDDERHLSVLPLGVLLENIAGVWAALFAGSTVHVPALAAIGLARPFQPDFARLLQVIDEQAISTLILVPELLRGLIECLQRSPRPLPRLRFVAVGGAKVTPALILRARALGLPVHEGYGLSECGSVVALNTPQHDRPGSAGRLLPHVVASVHQGEIVIANPIFTGYVGTPHHGDFATGDLGAIDETGHVRLHGRRHHLIITSHGRNISPEWVEAALLDQPGIRQAIVHGDGEPALSALVVPAGPAVDVPAAVERANLGLPDYARIASHVVVAPFTVEGGLLTANGRPRRAAILAAHTDSHQHKEKPHEALRSSGA